MARLFFASLITFGILVGMVIGCVLAAMVYLGEVNFTAAIVLTVIINLVIWLISPWLSDLTLRWFNQLEFLDDAAGKQRYPAEHQLSFIRWPTNTASPRRGLASSPTVTRPPSPTGCSAPTRASS